MRELLAGAVRRLEVLADAEAAVGIDAPRELDPELVLLPHLAEPGRLVRLPGAIERLARAARSATRSTGWRKPIHCAACVSWDMQVVALGAVAHRQHVVGEPRGLAPDRREAGVALDLRLVGQHLDPGQAVGIGPHRVVDAREVHRELAAALLEEVRQQEAHLEERERVLRGISSSFHTLRRRRHHGRRRHELVPGVGRGAARRRRPRPSGPRAARARAPPASRRGCRPRRCARRAWRAPSPRVADLARDLARCVAASTPLSRCGELRRVRRRRAPRARRSKRSKVTGSVRALLAQVLLPVDPAAHELAVVAAARA